jgi:hypothetical protein
VPFGGLPSQGRGLLRLAPRIQRMAEPLRLATRDHDTSADITDSDLGG